MLRGRFVFAIVCLLALAPSLSDAAEPLRIIVFGAHPDDAELKAGGTAAKWAKLGHKVKLVSVTNGDIGHWSMDRGPLAARRLQEVQAADKLLGATCEVLDIHDGELEPTLENRKTITRLIRDWQADIVISHRPWDYHPDHRYVGVLVQDAAFMVTVPKFCPETPALKVNPVFLYSSDGFEKPYRFTADICVALDDVIETKWAAIHELESQLYEGGALGSQALVDSTPPASQPELRQKWFRESHRWAKIDSNAAEKYRDTLARWYGADQAKQIKFAEAFEICEYGRRVTAEELKTLFPFFPK